MQYLPSILNPGFPCGDEWRRLPAQHARAFGTELWRAQRSALPVMLTRVTDRPVRVAPLVPLSSLCKGAERSPGPGGFSRPAGQLLGKQGQHPGKRALCPLWAADSILRTEYVPGDQDKKPRGPATRTGRTPPRGPGRTPPLTSDNGCGDLPLWSGKCTAVGISDGPGEPRALRKGAGGPQRAQA